jgi:hypothetical protein
MANPAAALRDSVMNAASAATAGDAGELIAARKIATHNPNLARRRAIDPNIQCSSLSVKSNRRRAC